MVKADGVLLKVRYRLKNGDEYTGQFLGKSAEIIIGELAAIYGLTPYHILEQMVVCKCHAISSDFVNRVFEQHSHLFLKPERGDTGIDDVDESEPNSRSEVPYF